VKVGRKVGVQIGIEGKGIRAEVSLVQSEAGAIGAMGWLPLEGSSK